MTYIKPNNTSKKGSEECAASTRSPFRISPCSLETLEVPRSSRKRSQLFIDESRRRLTMRPRRRIELLRQGRDDDIDVDDEFPFVLSLPDDVGLPRSSSSSSPSPSPHAVSLSSSREKPTKDEIMTTDDTTLSTPIVSLATDAATWNDHPAMLYFTPRKVTPPHSPCRFFLRRRDGRNCGVDEEAVANANLLPPPPARTLPPPAFPDF